MISCLIIEDELPAQNVLKAYVEDSPTLQLLTCCTTALEAIEVLRNHSVDLIFLDIHLPKLSGLNFLRSLNQPPKVIITSAYPEYALEGFELNVIDYLLKPFSFERFITAINKFPTKIATPVSNKTLNSPIQDHIFVKLGRTLKRVLLEDIVYLQSDKDFVKIFTNTGHFLELQSLKYYEQLLPDNFMRIHKSYLINLDKLVALKGNQVEIAGKLLPIGRNYRETLMKILKV